MAIKALFACGQAVPFPVQISIGGKGFSQLRRYLNIILIIDVKAHIDSVAAGQSGRVQKGLRQDKIFPAISNGVPCASDRAVANFSDHSQFRKVAEGQDADEIIW